MSGFFRSAAGFAQKNSGKIGTVTGVASTLLSMYGASAAFRGANEEAALYEREARRIELSAEENYRREIQSVIRFKEKQAIGFAGSGFAVSGTALDVLAETEQRGFTKADFDLRAEQNRAELSRMRGSRMTGIGRSQLFSGFGGALVQGLTLLSKGAAGTGNPTGTKIAASGNFTFNQDAASQIQLSSNDI